MRRLTRSEYKARNQAFKDMGIPFYKDYQELFETNGGIQNPGIKRPKGIVVI